MLSFNFIGKIYCEVKNDCIIYNQNKIISSFKKTIWIISTSDIYVFFLTTYFFLITFELLYISTAYEFVGFF